MICNSTIREKCILIFYDKENGVELSFRTVSEKEEKNNGWIVIVFNVKQGSGSFETMIESAVLTVRLASAETDHKLWFRDICCYGIA